MLARDLYAARESLRDLIREAKVIVPFTGAGISTECGIPDFRSPGGNLDQEPANPVRRVSRQPGARDESWRRRFAMGDQFGHAQPGRGHRALASLYRAGKVPAVVTSEHRQSASSLWHRTGTRRRTPRQYDLRFVPRLRTTLRAGLGSSAHRRGQRLRARLPDLRRLHQTATVSFGQAMPVPQCGVHGTSRCPATCSCRSAVRSWSGRRPDSP